MTLRKDSPEGLCLATGTVRMRTRPSLKAVQPLGELPQDVRRTVRRSASQNGGTAPMSVWGGLAYAVAVGVTSAASGLGEAF